MDISIAKYTIKIQVLVWLEETFSCISHVLTSAKFD